jgi:hypothetical protein
LKGEQMKRKAIKSVTALAVAAGLGIGVPAVASASSGVSVSVQAHSSTTTSTPTAWTTWRATWKTYVEGLKTINTTFHTSVQSARTTLQAALQVATTKAERQAALATFDASVALAVNTRVSAITAAGDPPAPPAGYNGTAWVTSYQNINETYRTSVASAQATYATAIAAATTATEREAAKGALKTSVGDATTVRATALTTLGPPPSNPGQLS